MTAPELPSSGLSRRLSWSLVGLLCACGNGPSGRMDVDGGSTGAGMMDGGSLPTGGGTSGGDDSSIPPPDGVSLPLDGTPSYSRFVRLTHAQWEAAVRDLLRLPEAAGWADGFIADPPTGRFDNNERRLLVTGTLWSDYQRASESLAESVASDPAALARVRGAANDGATFVTQFGRRAFRRPLTGPEVQRYTSVFDSGAALIGSGDPMRDGVQVVVQAMLQSPHFVYRTELGDDGMPLSGYEVASKLSFTLLGTTPSDALLDAAAAGELDTSAGVAARARTMLDSVAGAAAFEAMHAELLGLDRYRNIVKNEQAFPQYDPSLNEVFREADRRFLDYIYNNDLGLRDLLLSPVAFVTNATAQLYGVTAQGPDLQQVQLDGATRPGFFTRSGFLALHGTTVDPDPIHRGVELNREILCTEFPPPPGEIPPLPEIQSGQTNRQRVNAHTGPGTCGAGCHSEIINPLGFAFESYDAVGMLRSIDNGQPVDTTGSYRFPDGLQSFANARELLGFIAESPQAHACYAKHVAEFALGRDLTGSDGLEVYTLMDVSREQGSSLKEMVMTLVQSPAFLVRNGGAQ